MGVGPRSALGHRDSQGTPSLHWKRTSPFPRSSLASSNGISSGHRSRKSLSSKAWWPTSQSTRRWGGSPIPRAHVMLTMREIHRQEVWQQGAGEERSGAARDWRAHWERVANRELGKAGHETGIDHRKLEWEQQQRNLGEEGRSRLPGLQRGDPEIERLRVHGGRQGGGSIVVGQPRAHIAFFSTNPVLLGTRHIWGSTHGKWARPLSGGGSRSPCYSIP